MATRFCSRCYDRMVAALRLRCGNDPTISLDRDNCNFACQIPLYEMDEQGRPIVKIWDCSTNQTMFYSQEAWERKQRDEEV